MYVECSRRCISKDAGHCDNFSIEDKTCRPLDYENIQIFSVFSPNPLMTLWQTVQNTGTFKSTIHRHIPSKGYVIKQTSGFL